MNPTTGLTIGGGETALFWILAPLIVIAASGLLFVRKAVHAAVLVAFVMISLAAMYAAQEAPFLFAAQIVVYTGAVMMLFLFVLMLVGVDSADSLKETLTGQRWVAVLGGLGLAFFLIACVVGVDITFNHAQLLKLAGWTQAPAQGLAAANADTNPVGVARQVFGPYVFTFEVVGTLLVIAALGAIVLTHAERQGPKLTQRYLADLRVRTGRQVGPLPSPGVFARHNAVDVPALLPDGTPSELSISRVLRARGQEGQTSTVSGQVAVISDELRTDTHPRDASAETVAELEAPTTSTTDQPGTPRQTGTIDASKPDVAKPDPRTPEPGREGEQP